MKGKLVKSLAQLKTLADNRKAVHVLDRGLGYPRHIPASWVLNFSGFVLHRLFTTKSLREHKKK